MIKTKKQLFIITTLLQIPIAAVCMEPQPEPAAIKRYTRAEMLSMRQPALYDFTWIVDLAHQKQRPTPAALTKVLSPEVFDSPVNAAGDSLLHLAIRIHDVEATAFLLEVYAKADVDSETLVNAEGQTPRMLNEALLKTEVAPHNLVVQGRIWCLFNPSITLSRPHSA